MLALAQRQARMVANAHTHRPGAAEAEVRQRLDRHSHRWPAAPGAARPHLEILHDQVQANHGATWGALPEDALFYARQRGLDERSAHAR